MSATVSIAHGLAFAPTLIAMATTGGLASVIRSLRGVSGEMQALAGDLVAAQAKPMTIRIAMRATGASAQEIALRVAPAHEPAALTPDRCPVLELAPGGRVAA